MPEVRAYAVIPTVATRHTEDYERRWDQGDRSSAAEWL